MGFHIVLYRYDTAAEKRDQWNKCSQLSLTELPIKASDGYYTIGCGLLHKNVLPVNFPWRIQMIY
jgi:hypothetical protein